MVFLSRWFFSADGFCSDGFSFIAHFFFNRPQIFAVCWISTHDSLKLMVFRIFRTAIRRFRSSAIRRNGSRQTDGGEGFEGKPEKNRRRGSVSARPFCVNASKLAKTPEGGMFSSARKNARVRLHLIPIALFYAKKVL